jgi:hypothetical protein
MRVRPTDEHGVTPTPRQRAATMTVRWHEGPLRLGNPAVPHDPPTAASHDIPRGDTRRVSRGPRMHPALDDAPQQNLQVLDTTATRLTIPEGTRRTTMKDRSLRIAGEPGIPVTARTSPGGLIRVLTTSHRKPPFAVAFDANPPKLPPSHREREPTLPARRAWRSYPTGICVWSDRSGACARTGPPTWGIRSRRGGSRWRTQSGLPVRTG